MSTFVPLLNVTLTGATSVVQLSGIPQTYGDLVVVVSGSVTTGANIRCRVNNSSTPSVYREQRMATRNLNGTKTTYATRTTISGNNLDMVISGNWVGWGPTANDNSGFVMKIPQYSSSLKEKMIIVQTGSINTSQSYHEAGQYVCQYLSTDPVNSLVFFPESSDTFRANTTFSVYGLGIGSPKALGGNIVTTDGSYWYHAFTSTGLFTPLESLTSQYLIVAGGGGGGGQQAGGGGAGGVRAFTGKSLTAQSYVVSVGAGGRGGKNDANIYVSSGSNTTFNGDSVTGGGHGGSNGSSGANGANGGSGGGGAINNATAGTGNAGGYSPVEGYAGGAGGTGNGGAGGGGAGAAGEAKSAGNAGDGGVGTNIYNSINFSTWLTNTNLGSSTKVGGGGGGGANSGEGIGYGGQGGGGNGTDIESPLQQSSTHGVVNTGGGGGGGPQYNGGGTGGNGGSGLVIIRYPV